MPKEIHVYEVLRRPIVTEKSTMLSGHRQYVFEVALGANKPQIAEAVEKAFNVHVVAVNTMNVRGKVKRMGRSRGTQPSWKKAVVTLQPGDVISCGTSLGAMPWQAGATVEVEVTSVGVLANTLQTQG